MTISSDIKAKIEEEFKAWEAVQYAGKTKEERQKMAQFFTPPVLSIRMLEKFDSVIDKDILDPTAGAGGLLVAMVFAGADPKRVYGIELDPEIAKVCRARLAKIGVPRQNIHVGNALDSSSYEFIQNPKTYSIKLSKTGKEVSVDINVAGKSKMVSIVDGSGKADEKNIKACHKAISTIVEKELTAESGTDETITKLDTLFKKLGLQDI